MRGLGTLSVSEGLREGFSWALQAFLVPLLRNAPRGPSDGHVGRKPRRSGHRVDGADRSGLLGNFSVPAAKGVGATVCRLGRGYGCWTAVAGSELSATFPTNSSRSVPSYTQRFSSRWAIRRSRSGHVAIPATE